MYTSLHLRSPASHKKYSILAEKKGGQLLGEPSMKQAVKTQILQLLPGDIKQRPTTDEKNDAIDKITIHRDAFLQDFFAELKSKAPTLYLEINETAQALMGEISIESSIEKKQRKDVSEENSAADVLQKGTPRELWFLVKALVTRVNYQPESNSFDYQVEFYERLTAVCNLLEKISNSSQPALSLSELEISHTKNVEPLAKNLVTIYLQNFEILFSQNKHDSLMDEYVAVCEALGFGLDRKPSRKVLQNQLNTLKDQLNFFPIQETDKDGADIKQPASSIQQIELKWIEEKINQFHLLPSLYWHELLETYRPSALARFETTLQNQGIKRSNRRKIIYQARKNSLQFEKSKLLLFVKICGHLNIAVTKSIDIDRLRYKLALLKQNILSKQELVCLNEIRSNSSQLWIWDSYKIAMWADYFNAQFNTYNVLEQIGRDIDYLDDNLDEKTRLRPRFRLIKDNQIKTYAKAQDESKAFIFHAIEITRAFRSEFGPPNNLPHEQAIFNTDIKSSDLNYADSKSEKISAPLTDNSNNAHLDTILGAEVKSNYYDEKLSKEATPNLEVNQQDSLDSKRSQKEENKAAQYPIVPAPLTTLPATSENAADYVDNDGFCIGYLLNTPWNEFCVNHIITQGRIISAYRKVALNFHTDKVSEFSGCTPDEFKHEYPELFSYLGLKVSRIKDMYNCVFKRVSIINLKKSDYIFKKGYIKGYNAVIEDIADREIKLEQEKDIKIKWKQCMLKYQGEREKLEIEAQNYKYDLTEFNRAWRLINRESNPDHDSLGEYKLLLQEENAKLQLIIANKQNSNPARTGLTTDQQQIPSDNSATPTPVISTQINISNNSDAKERKVLSSNTEVKTDEKNIQVTPKICATGTQDFIPEQPAAGTVSKIPEIVNTIGNTIERVVLNNLDVLDGKQNIVLSSDHPDIKESASVLIENFLDDAQLDSDTNSDNGESEQHNNKLRNSNGTLTPQTMSSNNSSSLETTPNSTPPLSPKTLVSTVNLTTNGCNEHIDTLSVSASNETTPEIFPPLSPSSVNATHAQKDLESSDTSNLAAETNPDNVIHRVSVLPPVFTADFTRVFSYSSQKPPLNSEHPKAVVIVSEVTNIRI